MKSMQRVGTAAVIVALAVVLSGCSLWGWGANGAGQLGLGDTATRTTPTGIDADWSSISAGLGWTSAVRVDGTLWAWGLNDGGYLGDGTNSTRLAPVKIGTATTWRSVSAGANHTVGVRTECAHLIWPHLGG